MAGSIQPAVDEIVDMCLGYGLANKKNIHGQNCGVHPCNRAGTGVDPFNAQSLALKISKQGYSETKLENPMGFEKAESAKLLEKQMGFNKNIFQQDGDLLNVVPKHDIQYLPVTCSHTFAALNGVQQQEFRTCRRTAK